MDVRGVIWGPRAAAGYLVFDRKGGVAIAIDAPPGSTKRFVQLCKDNNLQFALIVNTHGHWEQIAENAELVEETHATLCAHVWDATRLSHPEYTMFDRETFTVRASRADRSLHEGEVLEVGTLAFTVLHTPGHSPGSVCLYEPRQGTLFSGDTLLNGAVGRTDIPGGDSEALKTSLRRLCDFPNATRVFPGHGRMTTIKDERWLLELALMDEKRDSRQPSLGKVNTEL